MQQFTALGEYPNKALLKCLALDVQQVESAAMARYHARYDNALYQKAIGRRTGASSEGKSVAYANALIDEALALCGHPWYKLSHRHWGREALEFLAEFVRQDRDDWVQAGRQFEAELRQALKGAHDATTV